MIPSILSRRLVAGGMKDFLTTTFHSTTPAFASVIDAWYEKMPISVNFML
jgi:hypothetical protein